MTTFLTLLQRGRFSDASDLLFRCPSAVNETDENGIPLSHLAAKLADLPFLRFLVEHSFVSLNTCDPQGRDLLHYATEKGDADCCRYLVERGGMDPLRGDQNGLTPYELAHRLGHLPLERYYEAAVGAPLNAMYQNPVRTGFFPDPSLIRVGQDYYMVNSSFLFFPCIPVSHSRDLIHWQIIGHAIENPLWAELEGLECGRGYWAPDISYCSGRYYICATLRGNDRQPLPRRQMIVWADKPEGPYSKPVFIDEDGIDPSLFHDDDGRHYMLLNRGARLLPLNDMLTAPAGEAVLLYYGSQKRAPEGPHLLKKDGWYYLFLAEGGTGMGHRETVARSRTLTGVYQPCPYGPILRQQDEHTALQRCGHGKPVQTQHGDWYMAYLCGRTLQGKYTLLGRETALDPITWTADGWPLVNSGKGPSALQKSPAGLAAPSPLPQDGQDWLTPRIPEPNSIHWQGQQLTLTASPRPMTDIGCRGLLLRRQTALRFTFTAVLRVPESPMDAGVTGYYDENSFFTFGLRLQGGSWQLAVCEQIGEERRGQPPIPLAVAAGDLLTLTVEGDGLTRLLRYALPEGPVGTAAKLEDVSYLSDEGLSLGKRFTGAMTGIYALGQGKACFDRLCYRNLT